MNDTMMWWMIALTAISAMTAVLGMLTFALTAWGFLRTFREPPRAGYQWDHRRGSVLMEKETYITNAGRFAPIVLTPVEVEELEKRSGVPVRIVYILEDPVYQNTTLRRAWGEQRDE